MLLSELSRAVASPPLTLPRASSLHSSFSLVHFPSSSPSSLSLAALVASTREGKRDGVIRCMAKEKRVSMVAKQIMRDLSEILQRDQVVKHAVLPESALGADLYLSSVTTITDVEVSADLQVAKVYVSVFGDKRGKEVALAGLKTKAKYIRSQLGKRMRLRLTPQLRFIEDDSIERGCRVIQLLDKLKDEREGIDGQDEKKKRKPKKSDEPYEEVFWDDEELDEDGAFI